MSWKVHFLFDGCRTSFGLSFATLGLNRRWTFLSHDILRRVHGACNFEERPLRLPSWGYIRLVLYVVLWCCRALKRGASGSQDSRTRGFVCALTWRLLESVLWRVVRLERWLSARDCCSAFTMNISFMFVGFVRDDVCWLTCDDESNTSSTWSVEEAMVVLKFSLWNGVVMFNF